MLLIQSNGCSFGFFSLSMKTYLRAMSLILCHLVAQILIVTFTMKFYTITHRINRELIY